MQSVTAIDREHGLRAYWDYAYYRYSVMKLPYRKTHLFHFMRDYK